MLKFNYDRNKLMQVLSPGFLKSGKRTSGFTLAEALLAIAIVGIIAALVLPIIITNYKNKSLDLAFKREKQTIESAILSINVNESSSAMGAEDFMNKYLKISKLCSTNSSDCFADKYWTYTDGDKVEYTPTYSGSCAILKNGMSVCMTSIGAGISTNLLIDLTGKKGPNVLGRDLRSFSVYMQTKDELNRTNSSVIWEPKTIEFQKKCDPSVPTEECCADEMYFTKDKCCPLMPDDPRCVASSSSCATETSKSLECCKQDAYFTAECCEKFPGSFDEAHCPKSGQSSSESDNEKIVTVNLDCTESITNIPSAYGSPSAKRDTYCNFTTSPKEPSIKLQIKYCPSMGFDYCDVDVASALFSQGTTSHHVSETSYRRSYGAGNPSDYGSQFIFFRVLRLYINGSGITVKDNCPLKTTFKYNLKTHKIVE